MFHSLIKEVWSSSPGLENLLLAGVDGIVVAQHHQTDEDDFIAAEAANLIKESQRFGGELGAGALRGLTTHFDQSILVIQMVTDEYFLVGTLADARHLSRIRYRFNVKSYEWYSAIA